MTGDVMDDVVQRPTRLITDERADLADIWHAPPHVLESFFVGFLVRHVLDRRRAVEQLDDAMRQALDRDLFGPADVEDLADCLAPRRQGCNRAHDVADMAEGSCLFAVAKYGDRLSFERLVHETRH